MGRLPDLANARRRLGLALEVLRHDRWLLGDLANGQVKPLAASEMTRHVVRSRPLAPLARRALFEQRPLVVNSVMAASTARAYDWERDWPALLYVPVAEPKQRPVGLLVVGCRRDHWYSDDDVAYAGALGTTLAPLVARLAAPFATLTDGEREVAHLISHGLSPAEIAKFLRTDEYKAHRLVETVVCKINPQAPRRELESAGRRSGDLRGLRMTW